MKYSLPRLPLLSLFFLCTSTLLSANTFLLGIDVLERSGFRAIAGKRVGLLTHPAGVNVRGETSIEVLKRSKRLQLVSLFGPEHGIYGDEKANVPVLDRIDRRTSLPVYSLYGKYRRPTASMLAGLDALVIDLQDIGARSYTYVSCMRYAMEACFEAGVEVVILDRPNPLGGRKVDGPPLDREWRSYVGAFHVPYVHGLTIGELARMAKANSGWMEISDEVRRRGQLTVVPMQGWRRDMLWPETGLKWIPTSPYIPDLSAALGYAMTGLGAQEGDFSHGIGTPYPFRLLRYKGRTAVEIKQALQRRGIPGLGLKIVETKTLKGYPIEGVYLYAADWKLLRPTEVSFHMMQLAAEWSAPENPFAQAKNVSLFNKHVGSSAWWEEISRRGREARVQSFVNRWAKQSRIFQAESQRFWLYR
ncbi:MAG: DUF1343 domain-containing protein [Coraliomargarita sp. TMED73]|nr:MAG: DUF1343 domain-containing protein [Coraliomargarita sp. TMED73]